ncbi:MAG: ABC transporter permease [Dehalococcoidia bacterium]|nr:ABC transporter permease [Dehalococcoidia bacterium]
MATTTSTPTTEAPPEPPSGRRRGGVLPWLGVAVPGRRTYRVWQRNRDVFFQLWRAELMPPLVEPVIMFVALGLGLGTYVELTGDTEYIQYLGPGVLAMFPMFASVFESLFGAYFRMDQHGTYAAILSTPARPEEIIAGDAAWAATRGAINAALILVVMVALTPVYGLIESPLALLTIPAAFVLGAVLGSLGLAYTSQARSISQLTYFFSLFVLPMFWFSGGFFPLESLPGWATAVAWFTPLLHAVELNRGLVTGDIGWAHLGHLAWLVAVFFPAFWLALWTMRRRLVE